LSSKSGNCLRSGGFHRICDSEDAGHLVVHTDEDCSGAVFTQLVRLLAEPGDVNPVPVANSIRLARDRESGDEIGACGTCSA
jgi:hypothetical protein